MRESNDCVDNALTSLAGRQWPGSDENDNQLRMKIMQQYGSRSFGSRHRGAIACTLAVLVLATAGFGAVGGFEMIRGWFITVEIDGVPVDVNQAGIDVEENGDSVSITVDSGDLDIPESEGQKTFTITATPDTDAKAIIQTDDGERTVDLKVKKDDSEDNR